MTETNIRIVLPGQDLYLHVRRVRVQMLSKTPASLKQICGMLGHKHGLAATPHSDGSTILVLARQTLAKRELKGSNWYACLKDEGHLKLRFNRWRDARLMAALLEQQLILQIRKHTDYWWLDQSQRLFYERRPLLSKEGIDVYRRYRVSVLPVQDFGIGVAVDVERAFFTHHPISWFFASDISEEEQRLRRRRFERLGQRQRNMKGTLTYELKDRRRRTCYFESFQEGITCSNPLTGHKSNGQSYVSLQDYYRRRYGLRVHADAPVALVSFRGLNNVPVAADRLRLRVMNDSLPRTLRGQTTIAPKKLASLIETFWDRLGEDPLGLPFLKIGKGFWQPPSDRVRTFDLPPLRFGGNATLAAVSSKRVSKRREHYRARLPMLDKYGCVAVPPRLPQTILLRVPSNTSPTMVEYLRRDLERCWKRWTQRQIRCAAATYDDFDDELTSLRTDQPEAAVFVFESRAPAMYYQIAHELKQTLVKRITLKSLRDHYDELRLVEENPDASEKDRKRARGRWIRYVQMSALDVLIQLGCVPWTLDTVLPYEAQLAIDVGHRRRHFALSQLVHRRNGSKLETQLITRTQIKPDHDRELINADVLSKEMITLFSDLDGLRAHPIRKQLMLRDGREGDDELCGIDSAVNTLRDSLLHSEVRVDVVDVHKKSQKGIRLWERAESGHVEQILEGTAVQISATQVVLANTGSPMLQERQVTAAPLLLEARTDGVDIMRVAQTVYLATHMNWSSPGIAQRLPVVLKQADDGLKRRRAQEVGVWT